MWLQRAERRAPPALMAVTQSSLPLQPLVAAQSFQQETGSISQLSQGHGRGSLLPLAPRGPGCRSPGPLVAGCGTRFLVVFMGQGGSTLRLGLLC